jgi:hypothetical protein
MSRVLATALMSLLIAGSALPAAAMDNPPLSEASPESPAATAPAAADPGSDEPGAPPAEDQTGADDAMMQQFTRHRPGACPEGPPCRVED